MDRAVNERKLYPWVSLGGKIYCPWVSAEKGRAKSILVRLPCPVYIVIKYSNPAITSH